MTGDVALFLAAVRRQARDASALARSLALPRGLRIINVHAHGLAAYEAFVRAYYSDGRPRVVAISMNPGPHGAVQTGIPFCDMGMARELLPGVDGLLRRPIWARSERAEPSGRKLLAFAETHLGGGRELYRRILFPMTVPLGILKMPGRTNVPLPALTAAAQRAIDGFLERHAAEEVRLAHPSGILVLGRYAGHVWEIVKRVAPELATLPVAHVPHPAARISDRRKLTAWSQGLASVSAPAGRGRRPR